MIEARSADGSRIGCEVAGEGRPLLVIHGSTADRRRWATVRDELAARFRLLLMDRRGRGLSGDEAPGPYALELEAEDIRAVVEAVGEPVLVLAHSYGGLCALEAATACPGIERMLVYEPAFGTEEGPVFADAALADVEAALARDDREAALTIFFTRVLELDEAVVAAMRGTPIWRARVAAAPTLAREARAANAYRIDPARMAAITAPTRFLLGTATAPPLIRSTRAAYAAVPGSDLVELPSQGHIAMETDPAGFVGEVEAWLSRP